MTVAGWLAKSWRWIVLVVLFVVALIIPSAGYLYERRRRKAAEARAKAAATDARVARGVSEAYRRARDDAAAALAEADRRYEAEVASWEARRKAVEAAAAKGEGAEAINAAWGLDDDKVDR